MGNWYTNVSVKNSSQADVAALLDDLGRRAIVTPEVAGWVTVYDEECDKFDLGVLESLALTLSTQLSSTTLAFCNADDDVLWFAVYQQGTLTTRYASALGSFEDGSEFPPSKDAAAVLARLFKKPEATREVLRILRKSHGALGLLSFFLKIRLAYVVEIQRHQDLAHALAIPSSSIGLGYTYVSRGELPADMERDTLRRTHGG
jgi:hypothetical protein